ncbi:uncharacterized protein FFE2_11262 [Fusarium fujikuroi]|nr:uncharacterized protein FFE2_11262 [Fusarium fujikuroi]
MKKMQWLGNI